MNFTPLRITTLRPDIDIPFSLYIFFKEQYLEYLPPGGKLDSDKFIKLRKQKLSKFFIADSDEETYQRFLDDLINNTLNSDEIDTEVKVDMLEGVTESTIEKLQKDPASEENFNQTRKASQNLQKLVFENNDALKEIFTKKSSLEPLIKHSLNVCVLAVKFAKSLRCKEEEIDFLSTAALMHDVGIVQLPEEDQELFKKNKKEYSPKEKAGFYKHTHEIVKMLRDKPYINSQIIQLIENHEENRQGSGPNKLKKLTKPIEILSLVNTYDKKRLSSGKSAAESIQEMMIDEMGNYELSMLQDFKKLLKSEGLID